MDNICNYDEQRRYIDFMKNVPTTWDEVRLIDGYPGKSDDAQLNGSVTATKLGKKK